MPVRSFHLCDKSAFRKDADKTEEDQKKKDVAPLEEDDEFEDFPVEGNASPILDILYR